MRTRTYFNLSCSLCNKEIKRRTDHKNQGPWCKPCAIKIGTSTHGESRSRLYKIWQGMLQRCNNTKTPNYRIYGGRGIKVCEAWKDYQEFSAWAKSCGYSDSLSIDRINVNGNYTPNNCRWVKSIEQSHNKRGGLTWDNVRKIRDVCHVYIHADLAKEFGVSKATINLVANNKIWIDPTYRPLHRHRFEKIRFQKNHPAPST